MLRNFSTKTEVQTETIDMDFTIKQNTGCQRDINHIIIGNGDENIGKGSNHEILPPKTTDKMIKDSEKKKEDEKQGKKGKIP